MHPFEKQPAYPPPGVSLHLDIRLKPGWRFDGKKQALVFEGGESLNLGKLLVSGTKLVPMAPTLANAEPAGLSEEERFLLAISSSPFLQGPTFPGWRPLFGTSTASKWFRLLPKSASQTDSSVDEHRSVKRAKT